MTRIQVDLFRTQLFARERQVCHLVAKPHFWASVTALPLVPVARQRGHREGARVGSARIRASPPEAADEMNHAGERLRRCEVRRLAAQPRPPARPNPAPQERPVALTTNLLRSMSGGLPLAHKARRAAYFRQVLKPVKGTTPSSSTLSPTGLRPPVGASPAGSRALPERWAGAGERLPAPESSSAASTASTGVHPRGAPAHAPRTPRARASAQPPPAPWQPGRFQPATTAA